jgi:hypothetical protein
LTEEDIAQGKIRSLWFLCPTYAKHQKNLCTVKNKWDKKSMIFVVELTHSERNGGL